MKRAAGIGLLAAIGVSALTVVGVRHTNLTLPRLWDGLGSLMRFKPTFTGDKMAAALKQMCEKEYHMTVEVRRQGNTLQVFFWRMGLMKANQTEMLPDAADSLEKVLRCATRVALSTDVPLKFIEVKMTALLTGGSVTLWRYVPDIRDSIYTRMAEDEYFNRLVLEMTADAPMKLDGRVPRWDKPITMEEFLGKQVVLRAKRQSPVGIQAHEDLTEPSTLVVVIDNWPAIEQEGGQSETKVADVMETVANSVVKGYRFDGFRGVILQDPRGTALRSWKL